jgi:hypothetical protein
MSGATSPLALYVFVLWTELTLRFYVIIKVTFQVGVRTVKVVGRV